MGQWRQREFKVGGDEPPNGVGCGRGTALPTPTPFGGSVGRVWASNIGLLYPKVHHNIGGDILVDVPSNQNIGGCVPGTPGGVDASGMCTMFRTPPLMSDRLSTGTLRSCYVSYTSFDVRHPMCNIQHGFN